MLLQSQTLLHSIISFLRDISDPLWEEDKEVYASNELIAWYNAACSLCFIQLAHHVLRTIDAMLRVVVLLHYLILSAEYPVSTIRHKLFQPQRRRFNGVRHMFFVTLGRIGYASPPDAISAEHKQRMDQMAGVHVYPRIEDVITHLQPHCAGPQMSRRTYSNSLSTGPSSSQPGRRFTWMSMRRDRRAPLAPPGVATKARASPTPSLGDVIDCPFPPCLPSHLLRKSHLSILNLML